MTDRFSSISNATEDDVQGYTKNLYQVYQSWAEQGKNLQALSNSYRPPVQATPKAPDPHVLYNISYCPNT